MPGQRAKQLWKPHFFRPESISHSETTWLLQRKFTASDGSLIIFKAGTKTYALDSDQDKNGRGTSELMLQRKYR